MFLVAPPGNNPVFAVYDCNGTSAYGSEQNEGKDVAEENGRRRCIE